jgi:DNA-binding CsgD family transcriptional regulator
VKSIVMNSSVAPSLEVLDMILEGLIDGVMILDVQGKILQANLQARSFCRRLLAPLEPTDNPVPDPGLKQLPEVIRSIFKTLIESRDAGPHQQLLPEFETHLADQTPLRIRGQFLAIARSMADVPYIFITIEDRQKSLQGVAIGDAQRFGLTPRETEVWQLRLSGRSYRDIAQALYITENTVRKHIKSILAKRRMESDEE